MVCPVGPWLSALCIVLCSIVWRGMDQWPTLSGAGQCCTCSGREGSWEELPFLEVEVTFGRACLLKNKYKRFELYFSSVSVGDINPLKGKWKPGLLITQLIC